MRARHPNVDPNEVLGKRAGSRRKSSIIGRDLALPVSPESPPAVASDGQSQAEHLQLPVTTPLSAGSNVTHGPHPSLSPMAHDSHPELTDSEPAMASFNHEDADGIELPGTADNPAYWAVWTTERVDQLHEEVDSVLADGQEWSVYAFYTLHM